MAQETQQRLELVEVATPLRHVNDAILLHWQHKLAQQQQPRSPKPATVQAKAK